MPTAVRHSEPALAPAAGEVHIWHLRAAELDATLLRLLHHSEIAKLESFAHAERRAEFLAARVAIRLTLSRYFPSVGPADWRFSANEFGKPALLNGPLPDLQFNLSHSAGIVACAVTRGRAIGIDIEDPRRRCDLIEIARSHFAAEEIADLERQPRENLARRFFEIWTLKEAYIKARGMGLSLPLEQFAFRIAGESEGCEIGIRFAPQLADHSAHWRFHLASVDGMQMALAVHDPARTGLRIELARLSTGGRRSNV